MSEKKSHLKIDLIPLQKEMMDIQDKLAEADSLNEIAELKESLSKKNDEILEKIQEHWRNRIKSETPT